MINAGHYHVIAVQDWGGTQESWCGHDDQWTHAQAVEHATAMVDADRLWWQESRFHEAQEKYGERLWDLISDNVAPGWDALWIVACGQPCAWDMSNTPEGEPWWRADTQPIAVSR